MMPRVVPFSHTPVGAPCFYLILVKAAKTEKFKYMALNHSIMVCNG